MKKLQIILKYFYDEPVLLVLTMLISGVIHGYNMFRYPYFENDEGVYFSQAWSFISSGKLSPYTYWYDHAPVGWIFTSVWIIITHGLFTFGFALNSARIFMLILHIISTFFLFKIARELTNSRFGAIITCLFFSFSPLAIYFQRRLLLDNIMTFWLLCSIFLILYARQRLNRILLSAVTFGIAVLSKENAIFFLPFLAWLVSREVHSKQIIFAVIQWVFIAGVIISIYPLYALLKTELFPTGTFLGGNSPHVSLLGSLQFQSSRGTGLPFWNPKSDFGYNFTYWVQSDTLFMILGSISFIIQGIASIFYKKSRVVFFITIPMFLFLASGKLVINFYVIPLVPLLALCIGQTLTLILHAFRRITLFLSISLGIACILFIAYYYSQNSRFQGALKIDETTYQIQAVDWIKKNINPNKTIAIDYYANLDLHDKRFAENADFTKAYWYWKIDFDPDITQKKLNNNFHNINYFLLTSQMYRDISTYDKSHSLLAQALNNSSSIAFFGKEKPKNKDLKSYMLSHPNGDWAAVYKQNSVDDVLDQTWQSYKKTFIQPSGQIIDPITHQTDSRQQGYTLLRTVMENDKTTFNKVFSWTKANMYLPQKSLFATSYGRNEHGILTILNDGTTTDSDQIIAYSLILASQKWHNESYQNFGEMIISGIWDNETAVVNTKRYVVAGDWTSQKNNEKFVINPSEVSPVYYRLFAKVDTKHDWNSIVSSSFEILNACSTQNYGKNTHVFLPTDWCNITKQGTVTPAIQVDKNSTDYSYEAYRVAWNIASDYAASKDQRDLIYLKDMTIWSIEWQKKHLIYANYTHNGTPRNKNESIGQYASLLTDFMFTNPKIGQEIYDTKIAPQFTNDYSSSYWGDKNSIFDQNWVWLCLKLYSKK